MSAADQKSARMNSSWLADVSLILAIYLGTDNEGQWCSEHLLVRFLEKFHIQVVVYLQFLQCLMFRTDRCKYLVDDSRFLHRDWAVPRCLSSCDETGLSFSPDFVISCSAAFRREAIGTECVGVRKYAGMAPAIDVSTARQANTLQDSQAGQQDK